jgi:hypothetical protein
VAVRTEDREVLQPVVVLLAVAVVELERERLITPLGDAAFLATVSLLIPSAIRRRLMLFRLRGPFMRSFSRGMACGRGLIAPLLTASEKEALEKPKCLAHSLTV